MSFTTRQIGAAPDVIAPDGSEVRILCQTGRGSMAHFTLGAGCDRQGGGASDHRRGLVRGLGPWPHVAPA